MYRVTLLIAIVALTTSCKKAKREEAPAAESNKARVTARQQPKTNVAPPKDAPKTAKTPAKALGTITPPAASGKLAQELKKLLGEVPGVFVAANGTGWINAAMKYGRDFGEAEVARDLSKALAMTAGIEQAIFAFPVFPGLSKPKSGLIILKGDLKKNTLIKALPIPPQGFITRTDKLIVVAMGTWADHLKKSTSPLKSGDLSSVLPKGEAALKLTGMKSDGVFDELHLHSSVAGGVAVQYALTFANAKVSTMAQSLSRAFFLELLSGGYPRLARFLQPVKVIPGINGFSGSVTLSAKEFAELKHLVDIVGTGICIAPESPFSGCPKRKVAARKESVDLKLLTASINTLSGKLAKEFGFNGYGFILTDIRNLTKDPLFKQFKSMKTSDTDLRCGQAILSWPGVGLAVLDSVDKPKNLYGVIRSENADGIEKACFKKFTRNNKPKKIAQALVYENKPKSKFLRLGNTWVMSFGNIASTFKVGKGSAGKGALDSLLGSASITLRLKEAKELALSNISLSATYDGGISCEAQADLTALSAKMKRYILDSVAYVRGVPSLKDLAGNITLEIKGSTVRISAEIPKRYVEKGFLMGEAILIMYNLKLIK